MFATLTYPEWDALCTYLERALAYDIPDAWDNTTYQRHELIGELADVHGLLMERPTRPSTLTGGF